MQSQTKSTFAHVHAPDEAWLRRAEPEAVLEPDISIIDAHLHLWHTEGYRYFLQQYAQDVSTCGHNVEGSVYVECFHMYRDAGPDHLKYVGETEFAVGMAAMAASGRWTSSRVAQGIVGHADLTLGERTRELLEAHIEAANGRFRGVRQLGKWDPDPAVRGQYCADRPNLFLDPEFGKGIDLLTSFGLSFDASVFHPQISDVTSLARAHPDASIVLIHCGSPVGHGSYANNEAKNHSEWLSAMKELSDCPNVSVKMGGILLNLANFNFKQADKPPSSETLADLWRPYIEPCIEMFGADRCMVSSNFPVDKVACNYGTIWNTFKRITSGCSAEEKSLIYSGTAKRVYRLA